MNRSLAKLDARYFGSTQRNVKICNASPPSGDPEQALKWDSEWQATIAAACLESGAMLFRPVMLIAFVVIGGSLAILTDPTFQGLVISLLYSAIASLVISPIVIPLIYYMTHAGRHAKLASTGDDPRTSNS